MSLTPLDIAHGQMEAQPGDEALRRQYYVALAAAELFVPLESETPLVPVVITTDDASFALAFDTEARLAQFAGQGTERAVMSGRALIAGLADSDVGLGINLGVAETAMLVPADALDWMRASDVVPTLESDQLGALTAPALDETTLALLNSALAGMAGMARAAFAVGSSAGELVIIEGASVENEEAIAARLGEALTLGGGSALSTLFTDDDRVLAQAGTVGLRFDLPDAPDTLKRVAPALTLTVRQSCAEVDRQVRRDCL